MRRLVKTTLSLVLLIAVSACQQPVTYGPGVTADEVAAERAVQSGMAAHAEIEKEHRKGEARAEMEKRLRKVSQKVSKAGADLCLEISKPGRACVFPIVLEPEKDDSGKEIRSGVNAYADGKRVVITPGMMRFVGSDEELALVVSHEYAHNVMEHVSSKQLNTLAGALVGALAEGLAASQGYSSNGEFLRAGMQLGAGSYSVDFEQEADYVGLYIMARSGYRVNRAIEFWRRFSVKEPELIDIRTTHPTNPERFVALQKTMNEIESKRKHGIALQPEFRPQS